MVSYSNREKTMKPITRIGTRPDVNVEIGIDNTITNQTDTENGYLIICTRNW
jgi:hypothetical protein